MVLMVWATLVIQWIVQKEKGEREDLRKKSFKKKAVPSSDRLLKLEDVK